MKKAIFGFLTIAILAISSCSKNNNTSNPGGSWTFKSTTYNAGSCVGAAGILTASTVSTTNNSTISVSFPGTSFPTTGGTYTVVNGSSTFPTGNQVTVDVTTGSGATYTSTGGNGSNQTVTVSVNGGKLSITGSGVTVLNNTVATDSSNVNFTINQLQ